MARTLVGILEILLKQDVTQKAPQINAALNSIERQAKHLGSAAWGASFQRQLDRLKISPAEAAAVTQSYDRLARDIKGRVKRADLAVWKTATVAHLSDVRAELRQTALQATNMHKSMRGNVANMLKPGMVALGAYTGWYAAGIALREGFDAASSRQREYFRQEMAGLSQVEQMDIAARSESLSRQFPSADATTIMEMARTARNTMGSTQAGLEILEDMVRGLVTLQSAEGIDAASTSMMRLVRGLDNLGLNAGGEIGLASMKEVIAGAIRAVQIEGGEIDVGAYFDFARRSKVAGPALSDEFLATTAPALMQDMTASTAGNAVAMFFKAFILGSKDAASKVNMAEQRSLGIRSGDTLIDSDMAGKDPYQWAKTYLVPALEKAGVDLTDETAVAIAIGKLSKNSNATGLLTRLVTQSEQIDRLRGLYQQAAGPDAADDARHKDPYVAAKGFTSSLRNLSAAMGEHVMPVIVPALNSLADSINTIAAAARGGEGWQVGLASLGVVLGTLGAIKVGAGIIGGVGALVTAGPSLQTAALMLQEAAVAQGGGLPGGGLGKGSSKIPGVGLVRGGMSAALLAGGAGDIKSFGEQVAKEGGKAALAAAKVRGDKLEETLLNVPLLGDYMRWGKKASDWVHSAGKTSPASEFEMFRNAGPEIYAGFNPDITSPAVDASGVAAANAEAKSTLETLGKLGNTITPLVDTTHLVRMVALLQQAISLQQKVSSTPHSSSGVRSSFSDYGVAP